MNATFPNAPLKSLLSRSHTDFHNVEPEKPGNQSVRHFMKDDVYRGGQPRKNAELEDERHKSGSAKTTRTPASKRSIFESL